MEAVQADTREVHIDTGVPPEQFKEMPDLKTMPDVGERAKLIAPYLTSLVERGFQLDPKNPVHCQFLETREKHDPSSQ
ncbi:MAG: hypothetical protein WA843_05035 [Candidatus Saccharimonadales bacterium]